MFTARLIFSRFTFGEAAYAGLPTLSWQTTVVGDPLYRPFAKSLDLLHQELTSRKSNLTEWSWLRLANLNLVNGKPIAEVVLFLEEVNRATPSAVLTEKLGDLYTAQGKPSSAIYAYAQALRLAPSPQQHVRLLLNLAERLPALNRQPEAYEYYQKLVRDCPDYPDKLGIYRKLLSLAQKLDKRADAEQYEAEINRLAPPPPTPSGTNSGLGLNVPPAPKAAGTGAPPSQSAPAVTPSKSR